MTRRFSNRFTTISATVVLAVAAGGAAAASAAGGGARAQAARSATVMLRHTSIGTILTSASGATLYLFTRDRANQNSCVKVSGCNALWPPLAVSGSPTAGAGVRASLLSTIRLSNGTRQVTYAGHALYLFSEGERPGEVAYVGEKGSGGTWYAVNAAGGAVK
jgi:predicted lipoprotein with Yx(FWY)xxD motif